jgi:hypothetical protein
MMANIAEMTKFIDKEAITLRMVTPNIWAVLLMMVFICM